MRVTDADLHHSIVYCVTGIIRVLVPVCFCTRATVGLKNVLNYD